jgi:hypothetical protein
MVSSFDLAISFTSMTTTSRLTPDAAEASDDFLLAECWEEDAGLLFLEAGDLFLFAVWLDVDGSALVPICGGSG